MKKIYLLFLLLLSYIGAEAFNVTFRVDMSNVAGFTTANVNGNFNGWCGPCAPMTDANSDGIWETTIDLPAGNYEYKFTADGWGQQENLTPNTSCTVTNFGYTNRSLSVSDDITLPVVCWGACTNCTSVYPVTFKVDMSNVTSSYTQVQIGGMFNGWNPPANPMTDINNDGIFETTINLAPGTYEYKFAADNWAISENLIANTSCTVTNFGYTNRTITVTNSGQVLDPVCWASCVTCSQAPPSYTVTFRVNMQNQTGFTTPEVNGTFNNWCGNCNPLTDANADGIWETTLTLQGGTYEYKFSADGWGSQENLQAGSSCTVTNNGYTNRTLNLNANTTLDIVCWGSCLNCNPPTYPVTFKVDMSNQTGFTTPEVNGTFNNWCGNCNPMTDANSDGIWETTIDLPVGIYEYKFTADSWGSQENLQAGSSCTVTNNGYTNRTITVGAAAQNLDVVCWASCAACVISTPGCTNSAAANYNPAATVDNGTCLYATNFNVDMTCAGTFTNVYITGPWCGWCGADTYNILTDANADGIYNVTVNLPAGNVEYKYMVDNWASQENLVDDMQNGGTCAPITDYANFANRQIVVGTTTNDVYGRCTACQAGVPGCIDVAAVNYNPIATYTDGSCLYATQFNVDMNCAGTSFINVYVTGPWCGWCGAETYNLMTDANADGIYTVSVNLAAGNVEYKYMVDNWNFQENLVDDMQNGASCAPVTDFSSYANRLSPTGQVKNDVYGRCSACPVLGCTDATACNYSALATQDDASCTFATTWYLDVDSDGYYVSSTSNCNSPGAGYTTTPGTSGDCNDNNAAVNAGANESCSTAFDDNCNGQTNEGCIVIAGDNPSNAASIITSTWPNCSASNGTLIGAGASSSALTTCLTGEDKWHQFVASTEAVSIVVNSTSNDIVIELQTAGGVLIAQENAVAGLGGEILNHSGLVAGQQYKVGVRNYNSALGVGGYSICVKMLKRAGCDYGAGPYSLCQYFKATYAGSTGVSYTFTFTGTSGPALGNTYTRTQNSNICVLSTITPTLPYGSSYSLLVSNTYSIANANGTIESITVPALNPCSVSTLSQIPTALRPSNRCSDGQEFRGAVVKSLPWICGVTNWRWRFQELDASGNPVGLPIELNRGAASNVIALGTISQLQFGKTYAVQTAPIFSYTGLNYEWGPAYDMCIIGSAGMVAESAQGTKKDAFENNSQESALNVFPNPTTGNSIQVMLSGMEGEVAHVRVLDAMGNIVWVNKFNTLELSNTNIEFEDSLADGMYFLQIVSGKETISQRFLVKK